MDFWLYLVLGVALGVWACAEQVRTDKKRQRRQAMAKSKPANHTASKFTSKSDSDGYTRIFDRSGACVYESPDKSDAIAWKRAHE